jgi:hypothetical protein
MEGGPKRAICSPLLRPQPRAHLVVRIHKSLDLLWGARLLLAKLVAGEGQDLQQQRQVLGFRVCGREHKGG